MPKLISPQVEFALLLNQTRQATPEIFAADGTAFLNLLVEAVTNGEKKLLGNFEEVLRLPAVAWCISNRAKIAYTHFNQSAR